jgi:hypothetical protein
MDNSAETERASMHRKRSISHSFPRWVNRTRRLLFIAMKAGDGECWQPQGWNCWCARPGTGSSTACIGTRGRPAGAPGAGETMEVSAPRKPGEPVPRPTLALHSMPIILHPPQRRKRLGKIDACAILATQAALPRRLIERLLLTLVPRLGWTIHRRCALIHADGLSKSGIAYSDGVQDRLMPDGKGGAPGSRADSLFHHCMGILYASMPARIGPDLPCIILLGKEEWQALYCNIERMPEPATAPFALAQAMLWIARIGGFLARDRRRLIRAMPGAA